jgi:hypothetical protein
MWRDGECMCGAGVVRQLFIMYYMLFIDGGAGV